MNVDAFKFRAFISYSHGDREWATWLHRTLERYRLPKDMADANATRRLGKCFRDEEELGAAAELGPKIEAALQSSDAMIVICSPRAARSQWVNREIAEFKKSGREHRIFALIVDRGADDGESADYMPSALYKSAADLPSEPLAVDVEKFGRADAAVRIVSGLLDVDYDTLRQRELRRRRAELFRAQAFFVAGLTLSLAAIAGGYFAAANYVRASELRATLYAGSAEELAAEGNYSAALLMALHGDPAAEAGILERWFRPEGYTTARNALARALVGNRLRATFPATGRIVALRPTLNGDELTIASAHGDGVVVQRVAIGSGAELASKYLSFAEPITSIALLPDGDTFAFGSSFNVSVIERLSAEDDGQDFSDYVGPAPDHIETIAISHDGRRMLAGGNASRPALWQVNRATPVQTFDLGEDLASSVAFMPDEQEVVIGTRRGSVYVWRIGQTRPMRTFTSLAEDWADALDPVNTIEAAIDAVAIHPAGSSIATLFAGRVRIHNVGGEAYTEEVACTESDVTAIAYSPDGELFAAGCDNGTTQIWDTTDFYAYDRIGHGDEVTALAFTQDSTALVIGQRDGAVRLWSVRTAPRWIVRFDSDRPRSFIAEDGRLALAANGDVTTLFDLIDGDARDVHLPIGEGAGLLSNNDIVVRTYDDIRALDPDLPEAARVLVPYSGSIISASPDGRIVLLDGSWRREGADAPESVAEFPFGSIREAGLQTEISANALSSDGATAAVGTEAGFFAVRRSGAEVGIYATEGGDGERVWSITFFPGSERLVVGGPYGGASIWQMGRNTPVQILPDSEGVSAVAVSDDSGWISTGGLHGAARLWRRNEVVPAQTFIDRRLGRLTSVRLNARRGEFIAIGERGVARWPIHPALNADGRDQVRMACTMLQESRVLDFTEAEFRRFPIVDRNAPHPCAGIWGIDPRRAPAPTGGEPPPPTEDPSDE